MKQFLKSFSKLKQRSSRRLRDTENATETSASGTVPDVTTVSVPLEQTSHQPALEYNQSPSSMGRPTTSPDTNTEAMLQSVGQSVFGFKESPESEGDVSRMGQNVAASGTFNNVVGVQLNMHGASDTAVARVTRQVLQQQQKGPLQSSTPPPAPRMCFGREAYISEAVALIKTAPGQSINIPILGAGGMGKTTTALSILHHDDIKAIFGDRRYFVACEAATTAGLLLSSIVQVLDYGWTDAQQDPLTRMIECLNAGPVLLVIDNMETSWDTNNKVEVERILEQISSEMNVALLVTMRGTVCPVPQISWTMIGENYVLQTMTLEAARTMFLHVVQRLKGRPKDDLDRLLMELDGVPLAIYLMAELGNNNLNMGLQASTLCQQMIKDWEKSATSMLKRGHNSLNRLTSVEVSISLSLDAAGKDAMTMRCMAMLAHLPDGVFAWLDTFHDLAPKIPRDAAKKLVDYALLYIDAVGTLRMLSPIRHYTLSKWDITPADMAGLERFHANVMKINTIGHGPDHAAAIDCLNQHIGNISAVMTSIGHTELSLELMGIAQGAMETLSFYGPSAHLLQILRKGYLSKGEADAASRCLQSMGDIHRMQFQYRLALDELQKASAQFEVIGNRLGMAQCLRSCADIHSMQDRYLLALHELKQANTQFEDIGDRLGMAQCLQSMGDIHRVHSRYPLAMDQLQQAKTQFEVIGDRLRMAQCLRSVGIIHSMQDQYPLALDELQQACTQFEAIGDRLGMARCLQSMGNIHRMQSLYPLALDELHQANTQFEAIHNRLGMARCLQSMGNIHGRQSQYQLALDELQQANTQFEAINNRLGMAQCLHSMGDIHRMQSLYPLALDKLQQAKAQFEAIGDKWGVAQCLESKGKIPGV